MKSTIYIGATRSLKNAITVNGKVYPFAFDSEIPAELLTAYRITASSDPTALTNEVLQEMFKASKRGKLMADLEMIEGRPLSWITIYPEGGEGALAGRRGQFDQGPTLEKTKTLEPQRERTMTQEKTPERLPPPPPPYEPDMSF